MERAKAFLLLCTVVLLGTSWLLAQGGQTGAIQGTISDQSGAVVPGATITIKNAATGFERVVVSGDAGGYLVPSLEPGKYLVRCELTGFARVEATDVVVNVGRTTDLNINLKPAGTAE